MTGRFGLAIIVALLALALALALPVRTDLVRLKQYVGDGSLLEAGGGRAVGQSITSHYPGLAEIAVWSVDPGLPDDQVITLRVREGGSNAPERLVLHRTAGEIRDEAWLRFRFDPLDDSAGKVYSFTVETTGDLPLRLGVHRLNMYTEGEVLPAGGGDLVFELSYRGYLLPTARVLLVRMAANKPGVFGQPWFYALLPPAYLLALGGTAAAVYRRLRSLPGRD